MRFLQTKLLATLLLCLSLLSACTSTHDLQPTHPFVQESKDIELAASRALSLGNYRQAISLYNDAYSNYSAIDHQHAMQRQLINIAQTALLIEDLELVKKAFTQSALYSNNPEYQQRLILLKANLAIAEQEWPKAIAILDSIDINSNPVLNESVLVSLAIAESGNGNFVYNTTLKASLTQASSQARLARLFAEQAIATNDLQKAKDELSTAAEIYRTLAFQPGIAECLILEANIHQQASREESANHLRQRAKGLWLNLDNQRAITRHNL